MSKNKEIIRSEIKDEKAYAMVISSPNVMGQLYMERTVDNTLQDVIARFKRKQGCSVLWLPETDHAAIATEAKIVEEIRRRKKHDNRNF